jgi:hypothetical protein
VAWPLQWRTFAAARPYNRQGYEKTANISFLQLVRTFFNHLLKNVMTILNKFIQNLIWDKMM